MKIYIPILLIGLLCACKKDESRESEPETKTTFGYDHSAPQGKLLEALSSGNNKNMKKASFSYYNSAGTLMGTYDQIIASNIYMLLTDHIVINPTYAAVAVVSGNGPIINNTTSDIHIDNGLNYLYYVPDEHKSPTTTPAEIIKVQFTLSVDYKTLVLIFTDNTPGTATEYDRPINYSKRVRTYTFTGL